MRILKTTILSGILFVGILSSCCQQQEAKTITSTETSQDTQEINEKLLMATLYHQRAAEVAALSYQAYNSAKVSLDKILKENKSNKPLAIVTDVDETVLDNSPFQAKCIETNTDYTRDSWSEWCNQANAEVIEGATEFFNYAKDKGVTTFYITNRRDPLNEATIKNLQAKGFPFADKDHVVTRSAEASKEARRQDVLENYNIIMLVGDNLSDFSQIFEDKLHTDRSMLVDSLKHEFGHRFIVLPNAMYGDWVHSMEGFHHQLEDHEKMDCMMKNLDSF
ncbi:MAG: 5'-nucleotidase, lipoprotein e(P4) family [Hyphomicrobiales bacterium]